MGKKRIIDFPEKLAAADDDVIYVIANDSDYKMTRATFLEGIAALVTSVNGLEGDVELTTTEIAEGSKLYYTNERVDDRVAALLVAGSGISLSYNDGAGSLTITNNITDHGDLAGLGDDDHTQYLTTSRALTWLNTRSTADLPEGSNLYYTAERVDDRVAALLVAGSNVTLSYNDAGGALTISAADGVTDHGALSGLEDDDHTQYHTDARALTWLSGRSTTDLSEGTNKYYTDERVDDRVAALLVAGTGVSLSYNDAGNSLTITNSITAHSALSGLSGDDHTQYHTDARAATWLATKSTTDLAEGTNLYFTNERVDDRVAALIVAGTNVSVSYDDTAGTLTISSTGGSGGLTTEDVDDRVAALLVAGSGISLSYNDGANSLTVTNTIASTSDVPEGSNLYFTNERVDDRVAQLIHATGGLSLSYDDAGNILGIHNNITSTSDVPEGANLYFTNERVDDRVASLLVAGTNVTLTYNDGSNTLTIDATGGVTDHGALTGLGDDDHTQYHTDARALTWLGTRSTSDLAEGSNLYFTNERVDDRVAALLVAGSNISLNYNDAGDALTITNSIASTSDVPEGSNLYFTNERVDDRVAQLIHATGGLSLSYDDAGNILGIHNNITSTSDVPEGSNLYFTNERVDDRVNSLLVGGTGITLTYDDNANTLTVDATGVTDHGALTGLGDDDHTQYHNDARALTWLGTRSTADLPEGSNLYYTDERVDDRVGALLTAGTGVSLNYNDAGNALTITNTVTDHGALSGLADDDHTQYHTDSRALTWLGTRSTADLPEGSNLYFTNERVDDRVAALLVGGDNVTLVYDDTANTLTINSAAGGGALTTEDVDDRVAALLVAGSGISLNYNDAGNSLTITNSIASTSDVPEGSNLYFTTERVDDRVAQLIHATGGLSLSYDDAGNILGIHNNITSTTDVPEGSNLYYTDERVDDRVSALIVAGAGISASYNDGANTLTIANTITSTTDVPEGTNLYFTDERVDDRVASLLVAGSGISVSYNDGANTLTIANTIASTSDLPEGSNLYFTDERVDDRVAALLVAGSGISLSYNDGAGSLTVTNTIASTTDVPEGSNLYFTNERVDDRVAQLIHATGGLSLSYDDAGNILGIHNNITSTTDLPEGSNLYFTNERVDDRVASLLVAGTNITLTYNDGSNTLTVDAASGGVTDHGALTGLGDDDHTQYTLLAGRSGGQTVNGDTAASGNLNLFSTAHATLGTIYFNGTTGARVDASLNFSRPNGTTSEQFGAAAAAAGTRSVAFGKSASGAGADATGLGYTAVASANSSVAVGASSTAAAIGGIAIGHNSNITSGHTGSIAMGLSAASTTTNQFIVGSAVSAGAYRIDDVYFGKGVTDSSPNNVTIHATGASGADTAGGSLKIAAGRGTGSAVGGNVVIQSTAAGTTGLTLNSLVDIMTFAATGQTLLVQSPGAAVKGLVVQGAASQTANIFEVNDSSANPYFVVGPKGLVTSSPAANTTGSPVLLTVTGPAHTGLTVSEAKDVYLNLARTVTFTTGGGTIANQRAIHVNAPTYAAGATATITRAATVTIESAPVAGTNITLTTTVALDVSTGVAAGKGIVISGASSQSGAYLETRNSSGTLLATIDSSGNFSSANNKSNSEQFGSGAAVNGTNSVVVGNSASVASTAPNSVAVGFGATVSSTLGGDNVAIGSPSTASNTGVTVVGKSATASGANSVSIGKSASVTAAESVAVGATAAVTGAANGVSIGYGATIASTATDCVVIGHAATVSSADKDCVVIGSGATTSGTANNNVIIGSAASGAGATFGVAVGYSSGSTVANGTALGSNAQVTGAGSIALGYGAQISIAACCLIGSTFSHITSMYLGSGVQDAAADAFVMNTTSGVGTNKVGADFKIRAGAGTGSGTPGKVIFGAAPVGSSGSTLGTVADIVTVANQTQHMLVTTQANTIVGLRVDAASSQTTTNIMELRSSVGGVLFAVSGDGKILTGQTSSATTIGTLTNKLPVYNAAGTLVGYVPIYDGGTVDSVIKWAGVWTDRSTVLTTELNSLANGSRTNAGTQIDNSVNLDRFGKFELSVTFGSAPSAGAFVQVHAVTAPDGTNYEDGSSTVDPGAHTLVATIPVKALTTAQKVMSRPFPLDPSKTKFILANKTGQAFPASGSTLKLYTNNDNIHTA